VIVSRVYIYIQHWQGRSGGKREEEKAGLRKDENEERERDEGKKTI